MTTQIETPQPRITTLSPRFYRPNSKGREWITNFIVTNGGIGDYVCYLSAILWIAKETPQIWGRVYVPKHFAELAALILEPYRPRFQVIEREGCDESTFKSRPTFGPSFSPINATGGHPLDLGFIYYAHINPPPPEANWYPTLDLSFLDGQIPTMDVKYAVMTPGATTENRTMRASAFNGIKDHLIANGIVPIFLGKKEITSIRRIDYEKDYNYEGGQDLREQTTLLQAAAIMSKASLVVGLDNGLLHLAACTDTPVLFGYNIASPEHRRPRRKIGKLWEITPTEKLACRFCQSNMRFAYNHDFANCLYKDNACLDELADPGPWCKLIDEILETT